MKKGFTLIELLIVIAIIAILAAVVFVTLDPLSRFKDARDSTRWSDVTAILNAIKVDQVDNGGSFLTEVGALVAGDYYTIGSCSIGGDAGCTAATTEAACANLAGLVTGGYLADVPFDPSTGSSSTADYYISRSSGGQITIGSCDPEGSSAISVSQ